MVIQSRTESSLEITYVVISYIKNKKKFNVVVTVLEKLISCLQLQVSTPQQEIEDAEETANSSGSEEKSPEEGLFDMVGFLVLLKVCVVVCLVFFG